MIKNYFKIALRGLVKNKFSAIINIGGLAIGMAVAILIGLWIYDELSFNTHFKHYDRIAQVMQRFTINNEVGAGNTVPHPIGETLKKDFGEDFDHVTMSSWNEGHILAFEEKKLNVTGLFLEPSAIDMFSIKILAGNKNPLNDRSLIMLSSTSAKSFFGDEDPVGKVLKMDNKQELKISAVYEDLPANSTFANTNFISPWQLLATMREFNNDKDPWRCNCYLSYVQLTGKADIKKVSARIKDLKLDKVDKSELKQKPEIFLYPMRQWHLYSEFKNGVIVGGAIQYVWLFSIIGAFVLLLACINFMNLSTARSEKRAKEVGIRKSIGSLRSQLIAQFFCESILVALSAFVISIALVQLVLPFFNDVSGKHISLLWTNPLFWIAGFIFSIITGLIAGSYPALYLSSFNPVKVLKGTFRAGRLASLPRKILVVIQFSVSVVLIIGTIIVFRQIQFAKNRPIGYSRDGLLGLEMITPDIHNHFDVVKNELISSGAVAAVAEAGSPTTAIWSTNAGFDWKGKDPTQAVDFPNIDVSYDYGKTIGWQFTDGRDFSREFLSDSTAFVINETAAKFMGLKNPVGEIMKWDGVPYNIIGIIKDMVIESPYATVRPTLFHLSNGGGNVVIARINPASGAAGAISKIETIFKKYNPSQPFEYEFVDDTYAKKFGNEQRIGKLAGFFAGLAIFISCLGLFGMASFVAEQRTKEIGVRKVLGATVFNLWGLLSKEFVLLVLLSCMIAVPLAYYFLNNWLQAYSYHTALSWWIFIMACAAALVITLLTVSFQSIKAALANPVKSLRTE